jgi:hypothetical protein
MKHAYIYVLFLSCLPFIATAETISVETAATQFVKEVKWRKESVITGNFSCKGKKEQAILGTSREAGTNKEFIIVAIFINGLSKAPEILRYSGSARDPSTTVLTVEDMNFDSKEFIQEIGNMPEGMRPSKICKGINMSDGAIDSAHIYWNHDKKQFSDWVL